MSSIKFLMTIAACVGLAACRGDAPAPAPADGKDRLVVIGAGLAEVVVALGKADAIVGVDRTATTLAALGQIPNVGMPQGLSAEGVLALSPTAVLLGEDAGPDAVIAQLEGAGIKVESWTSPWTTAGALERITKLGTRLGAVDKATALVAELNKKLAALPTSAPGSRGAALFLYARGHRAIYAAGANTAADAVLGIAGFSNVFADMDGMKPVEAEALSQRAPVAIVIPEKSLASIGGIEGLGAIPGIAGSPAWKDRRILAVDDLALLGFGPGLFDALTALTAPESLK